MENVCETDKLTLFDILIADALSQLSANHNPGESKYGGRGKIAAVEGRHSGRRSVRQLQAGRRNCSTAARWRRSSLVILGIDWCVYQQLRWIDEQQGRIPHLRHNDSRQLHRQEG